MKQYINDDFLLTTDAAKELYHGYAENEKIIDYHCHLPVKEIAEDKRWSDIAELWLGGDHYKWRLMRSNGFSEELCTGKAPAADKFAAFAATLDKAAGNPMSGCSTGSPPPTPRKSAKNATAALRRKTFRPGR